VEPRVLVVNDGRRYWGPNALRRTPRAVKAHYSPPPPDRRTLPFAEARVWLGQLFVPNPTSAGGAFALGLIRSGVNSTDGLCAGADNLRVPAAVIFTLHPAKSFDAPGVCPGCV